MKSIQYLLTNFSEVPQEIIISDIEDYRDFELRYDLLDFYLAVILGYGKDSNGNTIIEFTPDVEDPDHPDYLQDRLGWLWFLWPDRRDEILTFADQQFKWMLEDYEVQKK